MVPVRSTRYLTFRFGDDHMELKKRRLLLTVGQDHCRLIHSLGIKPRSQVNRIMVPAAKSILNLNSHFHIDKTPGSWDPCMES